MKLPRDTLTKLPPGRGVNFAAFGPPASESEFQRQVIAHAESRGWQVFSVPDSRRATAGGFADCTFKRDSGTPRVVVAELKMPGERPRPDQERWLAAWAAMGVPAFVWRPTEADWTEIRRVLG